MLHAHALMDGNVQQQGNSFIDNQCNREVCWAKVWPLTSGPANSRVAEALDFFFPQKTKLIFSRVTAIEEHIGAQLHRQQEYVEPASIQCLYV